jgi:hypothetical protein
VTSTTLPRTAAKATIGHLMSAAFLSEQRVLTDIAVAAGFLWRCVCKAVNALESDECSGCGEERLWTEDDTPDVDGALLETLREALGEWFDERPRERRPAAISFSVTYDYDDGPAWATSDATAYFTDSKDGHPYGEDFERSWVADALVELADDEQPPTGGVLRVAVPPPCAPEPAEATEPEERTTEYVYTISEYARQAAQILGEGWGSTSGYIGAYGVIWGPDVPRLRVFVDEDDDLVVVRHDDPDGKRITVDLPNGAPSRPAELRAVGEDIAEIIRADYL